MSLRRRPLLRVLAAAGGGLVAGCGFHPLYAPTGARPQGAAREAVPQGVDAELAAVWVPVIPERTGMLLRQALQQRLEGAQSGIAKRYELTASAQISLEDIAIQRDNSTTRMRVYGSGPWTLRRLDPQRTLVASGTSRVLDGYDIANQQYFAATLTNETVMRQAAETLAEQIVQQVATALRRQAAGRA